MIEDSSIDEPFWPRRELFQILRRRSAAINITEEDVEIFTDRVVTMFEQDVEP